MPSNHHHSPILSYPNSNHIVCPLPRRTHSHSHPYYHHHHHHHHHHSRFRRTPSISTPRTPSIIPTVLSVPTSPITQSDPIKQLDPDPITPIAPGSDQDSVESKPQPEDEVLSEFLSLFIPSSPTISMTPVPSPCTLPSPSNHLTKHRKLPSYVTGHRPRSRLGLGTEDGQEETRSLSAHGFPHSHLNWLIASPISRCHNPLPRHAELDALASRLADPIRGLVLTDRTSDERPELLARTLTGTEFKSSTVNDHRLGSPVIIA